MSGWASAGIFVPATLQKLRAEHMPPAAAQWRMHVFFKRGPFALYHSHRHLHQGNTGNGVGYAAWRITTVRAECARVKGRAAHLAATIATFVRD